MACHRRRYPQAVERERAIATSSDGVKIAWASVGSGPTLIHLPGVPMSNVEAEWRIPVLRRAYGALGEHLRLIQFDGRGTGASQRDVTDLSLEAYLRDLDAVVEAAGTDRCVLLGFYHSAAIAIAWASRHPDRVRGLVLFGGATRGADQMRGPGTQALLSLIERDWDTFVESITHAWLGWPYGRGGSPGGRIVPDVDGPRGCPGHAAGRGRCRRHERRGEGRLSGPRPPPRQRRGHPPRAVRGAGQGGSERPPRDRPGIVCQPVLRGDRLGRRSPDVVRHGPGRRTDGLPGPAAASVRPAVAARDRGAPAAGWRRQQRPDRGTSRAVDQHGRAARQQCVPQDRCPWPGRGDGLGDPQRGRLSVARRRDSRVSVGRRSRSAGKSPPAWQPMIRA